MSKAQPPPTKKSPQKKRGEHHRKMSQFISHLMKTKIVQHLQGVLLMLIVLRCKIWGQKIQKK